jgi:hypothetical protein
VVRVTTDDGQRIVGIRIPPEQVGPIVAALGATRDLREPEEIFTGILDDGEEVTLVSGLKLCRKVVHREPVIELIGVDPNRFAEIRSLGLINEQIHWKQRFLVPTDEETGVAVLTDLLLQSRFDCNNHALHSRHRSRKAWGDHCLVRVSQAATSQVRHKRKTAGSSTCRKSLKIMVSRAGLEPATR